MTNPVVKVAAKKIKSSPRASPKTTLVKTAKKEASVVSKAPPKTKPRRRVSLSRDKILAEATRLFAARGYEGVSIRDIASACGIGIPSIYHFYGDKDSLYVSCCEALFSNVEKLFLGSFSQSASNVTNIRNFTITICNVLPTTEQANAGLY